MCIRDSIKTYQIEGKLKEPFWWGNGGNDKRSASIVKIETDEGIDGWGEGWGGINEFRDILKVAVIDQDPFEREKIWANMFNELNNPLIYPGLGGSSMSAIDIALWDITGKKLGVPISVLLGGKVKDKVHVYATGLYYTKEDFKEEVSERIKEAISYEEKGFNAMKIKIGALELEKDLERVSSVKKSLKDKTKLFVDANQAYDLRTAKYVSDKLYDMGIFFFEEPIMGLDVNGYKELVRYSKIRTYLNTFVEGIDRGTDENNFIHPSFMQCVTSTGRLSSRNPNFQNMPRGKTFPVRRAVVSRFEGGHILEGDYAQLEYRVAGYLSQDKHVYANVKGGVDVHNLTATIITGKEKDEITKEERQNAKAHTFAPLYGATGMGLPEHIHRYYSEFTEIYPQIGEWHLDLAKQALKYKVVALPSGREYRFPYVRRTARGITHGTSVKNYPVQGFATGCIVPIVLLEFEKLLGNLQSCLVNTVHDSIVVDVHPNEVDEVIAAVAHLNQNLHDIIHHYYNIDFNVPLLLEAKIGKNWLDTREI